MQDILNHFIAGFEAGAITYIIGAFCSFSWNKSQSAPAMTCSTQISTQSVQETTELDVPTPGKGDTTRTSAREYTAIAYRVAPDGSIRGVSLASTLQGAYKSKLLES